MQYHDHHPLNPGTYTCQLTVTSTGNAELNPGVYNLEGGINVLDGGKLTYLGPPGSGVLLYLPCQGGPNGCSASATFASGASVDLPPLNASQSVAASSTASGNANTTAMQDMWFWQDAYSRHHIETDRQRAGRPDEWHRLHP